jgi:hypothetical protein
MIPFLWTNSVPNTNVSNILADYVDAGGGVVLATFDGLYEANGTWGGRINSSGYNPFINPINPYPYQSATLGAFDASSPLMAGVTSLGISEHYGDYLPGLDTGATLVASWSNGRPLAGLNAAGTVANITIFPEVVYYGHATGDYRELFRNALSYTANAGETSGAPVPEPGNTGLLLLIAVAGLLTIDARRRKVSLAHS